MVSAEKDGGNRPAMPDLRSGILGIFQHTRPVALVLVALRRGQHPRHQTAHRIRNGHGGNLPSGEDKIPKGQLLVHTLVNEPLVNALVVAADHDKAVIPVPQAQGIRLPEHMAAGGEEDGVQPLSCLLADVRPAAVEGVSLHDCAVAAAVGVVVHLILFVCCEVPNLPCVDADDIPLLRPA